MIRKILKNSPVLRKDTARVTEFDFELQQLIDDMIATMRKANGVGLAAPQVGESKKIFVCEFAGDEEAGLAAFPLTVICNPKITSYSKEKCSMVEGCLSFPGMEILIKRPKKVTIQGQDRYGKKIEISADSLFARVIQHENDHLNSTLLIDHITEMPVFFIGTGTLGTESLKALINDPQYNVKLVVTGKISTTSRKHQEIRNPIEAIAKEANIPVLVTENINDQKVVDQIKGTKAKLGIMADFGQIIRTEVLNIPAYGIINIHPSLLPRHRGPSPVQQTILEGDEITGVTLILTSGKMDAGPVISQVRVKLSGSETSSILKDYLARISASLLLNSLPYYLAGDLKPLVQDDRHATYSRLFKKEDGFVDQNSNQIEIERKIRAFDSWPKVYTFSNGKRIQLLAAHLSEDKKLIIDRVKPEGKNEMNYSDFINGYKTTLTFSD